MKKIEKEVYYGNIKLSKAILEEEEYPHIFSLLLLKDKRIALCSSAKTIRLYLPSNDYSCEKVLQRHSQGITSICELDDGTIASCSFDRTIIIGDYIIKNAHNDSINKVISFSNNRMAIYGVLCFIKLRDSKTIICGCEEGRVCIYDIITKKYIINGDYHEQNISDILKVDNSTFMTSSFEGVIKVWKY